MMRRLTINSWSVALLSIASLLPGAAAGPAASEEVHVAEAGSIAPRESRLESGKAERPPFTVSSVPMAAKEREPGNGNPLWGIPLTSLSATRDRPIFSASRRPPPPIVAPAAAVRTPPPRPMEPEKPRLVLVGTIVGDSESFGIFVEQSSKASLRLRLGEQHDGWVLRALHGREAALEKDLQKAILSMPQAGKGSEGVNAATADPDRVERQRRLEAQYD
jgi:hypothetical protein